MSVLYMVWWKHFPSCARIILQLYLPFLVANIRVPFARCPFVTYSICLLAAEGERWPATLHVESGRRIREYVLSIVIAGRHLVTR